MLVAHCHPPLHGPIATFALETREEVVWAPCVERRRTD